MCFRFQLSELTKLRESRAQESKEKQEELDAVKRRVAQIEALYPPEPSRKTIWRQSHSKNGSLDDVWKSEDKEKDPYTEAPQTSEIVRKIAADFEKLKTGENNDQYPPSMKLHPPHSGDLDLSSTDSKELIIMIERLKEAHKKELSLLRADKETKKAIVLAQLRSEIKAKNKPLDETSDAQNDNGTVSIVPLPQIPCLENGTSIPLPPSGFLPPTEGISAPPSVPSPPGGIPLPPGTVPAPPGATQIFIPEEDPTEKRRRKPKVVRRLYLEGLRG